MLVVISDLHMEEEATNHVTADPKLPPIAFSRNLSPKAYRKVFADLAHEASRNQARAMHLVLAGDIFDLHRSGLWFHDNPERVRPYVNASEVGPDLEAKLLAILDGIASEPAVKGALALIRDLGQGIYWDEMGQQQAFPVPVTLHYVAGNHDRLINSRPAIRRRARALLGLPPTPEPFPRVLHFAAEQALVRHGHEYDRFNFGADVRALADIPAELPAALYGAPPVGDFVTIDIASALPVMIRRKFGDGALQADPLLRAIYERSLAFDDLRPQRAMLQFLLHMPERSLNPDEVWAKIVATVADLLEEVHAEPFLRYHLDRLDDADRLDAVDVIQAMLELRAWRWATPTLAQAQSISRRMLGDLGGGSVEELAAREVAVRHGDVRFVIAGHTHRPQMALLQVDGKAERYYIDTGTWRNRIPANADFTAFGRLKALTYAVVYGPDEDLGGMAPGAKVASVDIWSGFTQRW